MDGDQGPGIRVEVRNGRQHLLLQGTVDIFLVEELHRCAVGMLERGGDAVADCAGVEHIDTAGLQVLLALHEALRGKGSRLQLSGLRPPVADLVRLGGLDGAFREESGRTGPA